MNILGREVASHVAFFLFHNLRGISAYMRRDAHRKKYRHPRPIPAGFTVRSSTLFRAFVPPEALSSLRYSMKGSGFHGSFSVVRIRSYFYRAILILSCSTVYIKKLLG